MAGATASALDWALALLQAPGERHALRQRPLPDGVEAVLSIASGAHSSALADAIASTGQEAAALREAARFYAREILFHPQANAYRVLGVRPDAEADTVRAHHRLLQQWLHPDRQQSEDDAVFASRINTAWNQLRSPALRAAYDAAQGSGQVLNSVASVPADAVSWIHAPVPAVSAPSRWQRWPALVFGLASLLLVALALVEADRPPPTVELAEADSTARAGSARTDRQADGMGEGVFSIPRLRKAVVAIQRSAGRLVPASAAPSVAARVPVSIPPPVPDDVHIMAASPEPPAAPSLSLVAARSTETTRPTAQAPSMAAAPVLPKDVDAGQSTAAVLAAEAGPTPAVVQHAVPVPQRVMTAATTTPPATLPATVAMANMAAAMPSADRVRAARMAGSQLLEYLGGARRTPPPIWSNPVVQTRAQQVHARLHDQGRPRLAEPDWRIGSGQAGFRATYAVAGAPAGVVAVDMTWRAEQWLVTTVAVEPLQ